MSARPEYYPNPLNDGRQADKAAITRIITRGEKIQETYAKIDALMDELRMDGQAYHLTKLMAEQSHLIRSGNEQQQDQIEFCQDIINRIWAIANDIRHLLEEREKELRGELQPIISKHTESNMIDKVFSHWASKITMLATLIGSIGFLIAWASGILNGG